MLSAHMPTTDWEREVESGQEVIAADELLHLRIASEHNVGNHKNTWLPATLWQSNKRIVIDDGSNIRKLENKELDQVHLACRTQFGDL